VYNNTMLNKPQKIALLIMVALIGVELAALMSLVYFTKLPFFFLILAVIIKLFSFFLLGAVALFVILTMMGIKPKFTIEWWRQHMRELAHFFGTSVLATSMTIAGCVVMGVGIVFLLRTIYLKTTLGHGIERASIWIAQQFY